MNKLYLLALLGLAVRADLGTAESSDGWYAGDCFDDADFDTDYGYTDLDCADSCVAGADDDDDDDDDDDEDVDLSEYETDYADCFNDDSTNEDELACIAYTLECAVYTDASDTCTEDVAACLDDDEVEDCMLTAVCDGDADCETETTTGVEAFEATLTASDDTDDTDDSEERRVRKLKTGKTLDTYTTINGLGLYGLDTIDSSWPVYCDHYHLYSFGY
jgi:hypothetical protein